MVSSQNDFPSRRAYHQCGWGVCSAAADATRTLICSIIFLRVPTRGIRRGVGYERPADASALNCEYTAMSLCNGTLCCCQVSHLATWFAPRNKRSSLVHDAGSPVLGERRGYVPFGTYPIERNERGVSMRAFLPEPVADEVSVLMKASDGE